MTIVDEKQKKLNEAISFVKMQNQEEVKNDLITMYVETMRSDKDYDVQIRNRLSANFETILHLLQVV